MEESLLNNVIALCKRRGFMFAGSEIYGGLANTYDFGPLGVEIKNNIKKLWWKRFVQKRKDIFGLDGGILLNRKIWEASGHTASFLDYLVECKTCHKRFRVDHIEGFQLQKDGTAECQSLPSCPSWEKHTLNVEIFQKKEDGTSIIKPRRFNGMFRTYIGATEDSDALAYLRPETAQAIFTNFKNVVNAFSPSFPFGIAQIGKAFRNEITTGYFIFRTLEFEQMEIEYFIKKENWENVFKIWQDEMMDWAVFVGIDKSKLRFREHDEQERSHYSKRTVDLEYQFPTGFKEMYGLAYRGDFDLSNHSKHSGVALLFKDKETNEEFFPHVVEPSFGVERTLLPLLLDAYAQEEKRIVMRFVPHIAPVKVAVFPLLANKDDLVALAHQTYENLKKSIDGLIMFDDRGNIGKRYFSQDEIGTPFCVTVDFQSLEDNTVTVRDRDTTKQERISIGKLSDFLINKLSS